MFAGSLLLVATATASSVGPQLALARASPAPLNNALALRGGAGLELVDKDLFVKSVCVMFSLYGAQMLFLPGVHHSWRATSTSLARATHARTRLAQVGMCTHRPV